MADGRAYYDADKARTDFGSTHKGEIVKIFPTAPLLEMNEIILILLLLFLLILLVIVLCQDWHNKSNEIGRKALTYLVKTSPKGKEISEAYRRKIETFPEPRTIKDLECFVGICQHLNNHIPRLSEFTAPLFKLKGRAKRKGEPSSFHLKEEDKRHYKAMKDHVISKAQDLERRVTELPLEAHLEIGERGGGIEARNSKSKHPCLFLSKTWSPTECKYAEEERYLSNREPRNQTN